MDEVTIGIVAWALAAGLVACAWAPWRRRGRRRFNPYVTGGPVLDDELFVGRAALLGRLCDALRHGSVMLHGERRIGKTSLLHHLRRRLAARTLADRAFVPVLVDLQGVAEERMLAAVAEEVAGEAARLGASPRTPAAPDLAAALAAAHAGLEAASGRAVTLVLLVDEADELTECDPAVSRAWRGALEAMEGKAVAVMAGVEIGTRWSEPGSPWRSFLAEIEVEPLADDAVAELIRRPTRGVFTVEEAAVERLVALAGGRPHVIQRLCTRLVDRAHQLGRRTIARADVEAIAPAAADTSAGQMQTLLGQQATR